MGKKSVLKKLMPLALAAAMTLQAVPAMAAQNDVSGHWAEKTITEWQEKGFIKGYNDGSFKPDNSITRAEFVVIMNNAKGFTQVGKISLKDVEEGDWFYEAVVKAVPTTTPITAYGNGETVILTAGAEIPVSTTLTLDITGASALATENIKVFAFQGDYSVEISSSAAFTEPTEGNTGRLVLTLSGTAPTPKEGELGNYSNGLKVVIPKEDFTPMDGYTLPSENITVMDFKFVLNPAPSPTSIE